MYKSYLTPKCTTKDFCIYRLWRRMNMVIRLDKNAILNGPGDITTTFAV